MRFPKVLMIGCGGVGKALLEFNLICKFVPHTFLRYLDIIDPGDIGLDIYPYFDRYDIHHYKFPLTKTNIKSKLKSLLPGKQLVIDVSIGVNAIEVMKMCLEYNVMYVNTSLENWDIHNPSQLHTQQKKLYPRTLYSQYQKLIKTIPSGSKIPTMVFDHGMNPGMISQLAKTALEDAYKYTHGRSCGSSKKSLVKASQKLKLKSIHISEVDTQKSNLKLEKNTFYNTWSPLGFIAEGLDPVQVGYRPGGWIEKNLGKGFIPPTGSKNVRFYPLRGMDIETNSLIITPQQKEMIYKGMMIPHGEANTLSLYLSEKSSRPDVYYVYLPSYPGRFSIQNMKQSDYSMPKHIHKVLTLPEITEGYDSIGAYLMFEENERNKSWGWWTGTILSTDDVRRYGSKYAGPTEVQVCISLLACIKWMLKNRRRGLVAPEELPHKTIVEWCKPYLGKFVSKRVKSIHA